MSIINSNSNAIQHFNNSNFKLSWNKVSVWLKKQCNQSFWTFFPQEEYVKILNNVSGEIHSGTLTAIIGTSGSGKTTLLTTISQRTNGNYRASCYCSRVIIGDILLNNKSISRNEMKKISGFLPQQELSTGYLTVLEHMQFMARLKMDQTTTTQKRNQNIFVILNRLGLSDRADTKLCHLSGGELKKLSLSEQLITDPPFLFCDEPTTGLDSYNAENVVKILYDIANYGKGVVCTIHQPTYGIFEIFDQVVFLVRGCVVFHGSVDKFQKFFSSLNLECPAGFNPVEFYMSHFARNQNDVVYVQKVCDEFDKSSKNLSIVSSRSISDQDYKSIKSKFHVQLYWLLWRNVTNIKRNNKCILLPFLLYMFIACLLSILYWNITEKFDQKDIQNIEGLIFLVITETIFTFSYSILHTFPDELPKILRENSDGIFDPGPYYLSKILSIVPVVIVETFFYSIVIFWSTGLTGGTLGFIYFYLPILFCAFSSTAYGFALSTSCKSIATASLVSVPIEFLAMSYSGIYINIKNLPWTTFWLPYISQFYYGTEAISVKQWEQIDTLECENPDLACLQTGRMVMDKYGYHENRYLVDLAALFVYCIVCHGIGYYSFKRKCTKEASY